LVVDHPAGSEVFSSTAETTYSWLYVNPYRLYSASAPTALLSATDDLGADVTASLRDVDDVPAPLGASMTARYTLDFGPVADPSQARLIIDGWSIYGTPNAPDVQPWLEVQDPQGNWVLAKKFGCPAGDLKSMVVDVSNLLTGPSPLVRINLGSRPGARWAIDRIRLDASAPVALVATEELAAEADLHHGGMATFRYGTLTHRIAASDDVLPDIAGRYGFGNFTRYGDVTALVASADDLFAIMRHGDELTLTFPAPDPVAPGMERSYFLKADVFYKGWRYFPMDYKWVDPLPYHGMPTYPYRAPDAYPTDQVHLDYLTDYNTRFEVPHP
jgi:hypothetical protein